MRGETRATKKERPLTNVSILQLSCVYVGVAGENIGFKATNKHLLSWLVIGWEEEKGLEYVRPLGKNVAHIPMSSIYSEDALNETTVLIQVIGRPSSTRSLSERISSVWKCKRDYQI